jgi:hypothetical protein
MRRNLFATRKNIVEKESIKINMTNKLTKKEIETIIFALEEYANVLEIENSFDARNNVYELIWKLS